MLIKNSYNQILLPSRNLGNCLKITSGNYCRVTQTDIITIDPSLPKTFSFWIYMPLGGQETPLSIGSFGNRLYFLFKESNSSVYWNDAARPLFNIPELSRGWTNVTVCLLGSLITDWRVYVNGNSRTLTTFGGTSASTSTLSASFIDLNIKDAITSLYYSTSIMVFDKFLSSSEARLLYEIKGTCPSVLNNNMILGYYFNESSGQTTRSEVVGKNDASLVNYTNDQVGIPSISTNTSWCDSYSLLPITT